MPNPDGKSTQVLDAYLLKRSEYMGTGFYKTDFSREEDYQFFMRLWAGVALLYEMVFNTHLDTTMAPYTIARRADKD